MVEAVAEAGELHASRSQHGDQLVLDPPVRVITGLPQRIVRLIGSQNEQIPGVLEPEKRGDNSVNEAQVGRGERGFHAPRRRVQNHGVEHAIAVEKNRRPGHFADSHFISLARRRG